jgi:hypothetical protein
MHQSIKKLQRCRADKSPLKKPLNGTFLPPSSGAALPCNSPVALANSKTQHSTTSFFSSLGPTSNQKLSSCLLLFFLLYTIYGRDYTIQLVIYDIVYAALTTTLHLFDLFSPDPEPCCSRKRMRRSSRHGLSSALRTRSFARRLEFARCFF